MSGTSLMSTSRITPPAAPVIVPMIIPTQMGNPQSMVFCMPTMVNRARPMASKMKNVLCILMRYLRNIITHSRANPVQAR